MNAPVSSRSPSGESSQPWLFRKDWAAGEVRSTDKSAVFLYGIMALAAVIISVPLILELPGELDKGNKPALLGLIFPFVGVYLLGYVIYLMLRRIKYGPVVFRMASVPGVIDGTLAGTIRIPGHFRPDNGVHLRLCCVHRYRSGSGSQRSTSEKIVWEDEKILSSDLPRTRPRQYEVPVFFKIPADARPTDSSNRDNTIVWQLVAGSAQPGVDFRTVFEVPVFETEQSGRESLPATDTTARYQAPFDPLADAAALRIEVIDRADGGREFVLPATRNLPAKVGFTCFWLMLTGACWFLFRLNPGGFMWVFLLVFYVVFGFFELIFTLICLDLWFRSDRIVATRYGLEVLTRWLVVKRRRRVVPGDISDIRIANTMSAGETLYYDIQILTADGRKITAASAIRSKREAEWLAGQLGEALGVGEALLLV